MGFTLPGITKLLIALRFYAVGTFYKAIGDMFGVGKQTINTCVFEVSYLIATKLRNRYIKPPETQQEILDAKVDFMRMCGFPLCIGAIDGTHVLIQSYGGRNAEIYRNRKMVFSHNCQVAVSADVINPISFIRLKRFIKSKLKKNFLHQDRIIAIVSRWPGSAHDSTIFTHSNFFRRFRNGDFGNDSVVVADSAYPPERFVCKPLEQVNTAGQQSYQHRQIRTRNVIERVNGQLKKRFAILKMGVCLYNSFFLVQNTF